MNERVLQTFQNTMTDDPIDMIYLFVAMFTLNEISGSDTTSDARQEPVASGHSADNTDRGDRGAGDLEPRQSSSDMRHQYIYTDQTPDIMLNTIYRFSQSQRRPLLGPSPGWKRL